PELIAEAQSGGGGPRRLVVAEVDSTTVQRQIDVAVGGAMERHGRLQQRLLSRFGQLAAQDQADLAVELQLALEAGKTDQRLRGLDRVILVDARPAVALAAQQYAVSGDVTAD